MTRLPHVVVLGGGPAGCGAAYQLRRAGKATVTLLERQDVVGGNAGSFQWGGQWLDYGSHRLHHTVDHRILADIQEMLGSDFGDFSRHGRIRLRGKWLHFPIQTLDLLKRLDKGFALGMARDMVMRKLRTPADGGGDSFASVLWANLGPTMSRHFYFPYARKMWGREPEELSGIQARKRVSAGSFGKLIKRLLKPVGGGNYYYMRQGYGQISAAYADRARSLGAALDLGWAVTRLEPSPEPGYTWRVTAERTGSGEARTIDADFVWSTIPIPLLARAMQPPPHPAVLDAAARIHYRAMVLVYVQLPVQQYTTTDAHYFPEENVRVTRLSEPKNYFRLTEPRGTTVLCGEYPCQIDDELWSASDDALAARMASDAATAGIPFPAAPIAVHVRRLRQAYPIYLKGYEVPFGALDEWAMSLPHLLVYGRQGLFAHDNTHHALYMAYSAVECLEGMTFDLEKWAGFRKVFATHVVED
jgi:protoporphyrinogen oxidase